MAFLDSKFAGYWVIHAILAVVVVYARFDSAVISIAVLVAIFNNLGQRSPSSVSAYSIFNRGFKHLLGDIQPDAIDRQLRGGGAGGLNVQEEVPEPTQGNNAANFPSKYINRPCPCGSGLKAKKCCAMSHKQKNTKQYGSRAKQDDVDYDFSQFEVLQ